MVSACVIRETRLAAASNKLNEILKPHESKPNKFFHFANACHEARVAVCHGLSKLPIRAANVCFNKPMQPQPHGLDQDGRLHRYALRLLLERISWIARDNRTNGEGNGKCRLTFSQCGGLSYEKLEDYLGVLRHEQTEIAWDHLDADVFKILQHKDSPWLRAADTFASSLYRAVELSRYGYCEDRYIKILRPRIYSRNGNYHSYGMKFMPEYPGPEVERDNRYSWLSLF